MEIELVIRLFITHIWHTLVVPNSFLGGILTCFHETYTCKRKACQLYRTYMLFQEQKTPPKLTFLCNHSQSEIGQLKLVKTFVQL